ncbi:MAG: hypothetical protein KDK78_08950 [Chlamydiia bacterium]|nr:hypothetical protein [Chlamydiia bacterium]
MELTLESIKDTLERYEFKISTVPKTETLPFDQAFVFLGRDETGRDWVLHLRLFEGQIPASDGGKAQRMQFLNLFIHLPFRIKQEQYEQVCRLICILNKGVPLPAFGAGEADNTLFYNYTYPSLDGTMDEDVFLTLVGMVVHVLSSHIDSFEPVATGKQSLDEMMGEAKQYAAALSSDMEEVENA